MRRPHLPRHTALGLAAAVLIAGLALLLAACGSSAGSATGGGSAAPATQVDVQASPDTSREVSRVVTPLGAKLTAKSSDGTTFTLTVPAGALLSPEKVTLAPAAVQGLPFTGAQAGAVQLAPEGLEFFAPVTLKITSPKIVAADGFETAAYGYRGSGSGLYLDLAEIKGRTMTIALTHFSGYGAAQATPAEVKAQAAHAPAAPEDAFRQGLSELQMAERQAALRGDAGDPEFAAKTEAILRDWYDKVVKPALPTAKVCANAPDVWSAATSWMHAVEVRGMNGQFTAEEAQCIATMAEVQKRCLGGYKAVGGYDEGTHSGDVPDLAEPFTLTVKTGPARTKLAFTPTSKEAGTLKVSGSGPGGARFTGGGTYTVQDASSAAPVLNVKFRSTTNIAGVTFSVARTIPIQLVLKGQ